MSSNTKAINKLLKHNETHLMLDSSLRTNFLADANFKTLIGTMKPLILWMVCCKTFCTSVSIRNRVIVERDCNYLKMGEFRSLCVVRRLICNMCVKLVQND